MSLISVLISTSVVYAQMEQQSNTNMSQNSQNMSGIMTDGNMSNTSRSNTTGPMPDQSLSKEAQSVPGGPLQ